MPTLMSDSLMPGTTAAAGEEEEEAVVEPTVAALFRTFGVACVYSQYRNGETICPIPTFFTTSSSA